MTTIDESLLEKLEIVLKTSNKDWLTDLNSEEKQEIEIGLKEAENDECVSYETVMNRFAKWH